MEIILIKSYTQKPWRSESTFQRIERCLQEKWLVHSINTKEPLALLSFIRQLQREHRKKLFVFNIAEYLDEKKKVGFLPTLLDEIGINHLGSNGDAAHIGLNKATTKSILNDNNIPTPRFFVANGQGEDWRSQAEKIGFPLLVKPVGEGGHIGISTDSIVYDDVGLNKINTRIFEQYHQPALVEEFITGEEMREFSVGIIDGEKRMFLPIEVDYKAMQVEAKILSYEVAQKDLERTKLVQEESVKSTIIDLANKTFEAVGASDYSRVDIRMNATGYYVLEINIMPGLGPNSFMTWAAQEIYGLEYNQVIRLLVENSINRQI